MGPRASLCFVVHQIKIDRVLYMWSILQHLFPQNSRIFQEKKSSPSPLVSPEVDSLTNALPWSTKFAYRRPTTLGSADFKPIFYLFILSSQTKGKTKYFYRIELMKKWVLVTKKAWQNYVLLFSWRCVCPCLNLTTDISRSGRIVTISERQPLWEQYH